MTAATGLPTILLTAALVVIVCFWLLVAVGVAATDTFDADADLRAWGMGGVPVSVAFSVLTVLAWSSSVAGAVVAAVFMSPGPGAELLRMTVPFAALLVAWRSTSLLVRPLRRLFPAGPGPDPLSEARIGEAGVPPGADHEGQDPLQGAPYDDGGPGVVVTPGPLADRVAAVEPANNRPAGPRRRVVGRARAVGGPSGPAAPLDVDVSR
ncbi:hypothetical protein [Streptomyces sp. AC555_RSS877]|uniref:hypothetical protein n=1 Tax=Streptomyces sp. AC555_RSS877 TaxID=2823688 RepID=UPI001C254067|nr:hypothetical protein [Streptomyces sp. AC555_RSS877]